MTSALVLDRLSRRTTPTIGHCASTLVDGQAVANAPNSMSCWRALEDPSNLDDSLSDSIGAEGSETVSSAASTSTTTESTPVERGRGRGILSAGSPTFEPALASDSYLYSSESCSQYSYNIGKQDDYVFDAPPPWSASVYFAGGSSFLDPMLT